MSIRLDKFFLKSVLFGLLCLGAVRAKADFYCDLDWIKYDDHFCIDTAAKTRITKYQNSWYKLDKEFTRSVRLTDMEGKTYYPTLVDHTSLDKAQILLTTGDIEHKLKKFHPKISQQDFEQLQKLTKDGAQTSQSDTIRAGSLTEQQKASGVVSETGALCYEYSKGFSLYSAWTLKRRQLTGEYAKAENSYKSVPISDLYLKTIEIEQISSVGQVVYNYFYHHPELIE